MRVRPDRVEVAPRTARVGQVLPADPDEGPLGQPSGRDRAFARRDLRVAAAQAVAVALELRLTGRGSRRVGDQFQPKRRSTTAANSSRDSTASPF